MVEPVGGGGPIGHPVGDGGDFREAGGGVLAEDVTSGFGTKNAVTTDGELVDFDADGDPDLILGRHGEPNPLLLNTTVM